MNTFGLLVEKTTQPILYSSLWIDGQKSFETPKELFNIRTLLELMKSDKS